MIRQKLQEELKKSRIVLYFLYALSVFSVFLILFLLVEWIGTGILINNPIHVFTTVASLIIIGCTYFAWISVKNMEVRMESMEKILLAD